MLVEYKYILLKYLKEYVDTHKKYQQDVYILEVTLIPIKNGNVIHSHHATHTTETYDHDPGISHCMAVAELMAYYVASSGVDYISGNLIMKKKSSYLIPFKCGIWC